MYQQTAGGYLQIDIDLRPNCYLLTIRDLHTISFKAMCLNNLIANNYPCYIENSCKNDGQVRLTLPATRNLIY
jgi:hypothetical protein